MKQIEFIHQAHNRNIILFIHGFIGGEGTWNQPNMPSFPELLRDEKQIAAHFDIAKINYFTKISSFEKIKSTFNSMKRVFGLTSQVAYKNLGITELATTLKSIIEQYCNKYENIFIIAHSMGGLVTKSYLVNELAFGSEKIKIFFSLAVPHNGVEWATVGKLLYKGNEQVLDLSNNSTVLTDINQKWVQLYAGIPHIVYFYGQADRVVSRESAISLQTGSIDFVACPDDHYTISKPQNRESIVYITVKNQLEKFVEERKELEHQEMLKETIAAGSHSGPNMYSTVDVVRYASKVSSPLSYSMIHGHIPRKLTLVNKHKSISWLNNSEDLKEPLDVIRESKHVVILGGAGTGKSIELEYIAALCSHIETGFIPILIKLNKFVPRSLNEVISEYWSNWTDAPDHELLVILDGLDEIESHYKKDAIKYIELFVEQHPEINLVVSCRRNFYQSENEYFSGTLQGFNTFHLYDLSHEDIDLYILSVLGAEISKDFKIAIQHSNIRALMDIPFYLVRIVDMYSKFGSLPENKGELFQYLISQSFQNDIQHFKNAIDLGIEQERLMLCLETVALGMEDLGRNYLTDEEFRMIANDENRQLMTYCTLWKRSEEHNEVRWQFEHNNFQEFLAARILERQEVDVIKRFLAFPPEYTKIIPSWVNTLSFLLSLIEPESVKFDQLLRWLNEGDPEMVTHFEADRVHETLRNQLFQSIYTFYEERKIWINRDKFDLRKLAHFGQTDTNLEFLISKIMQGDYTSRVNALKLLGFMRAPISKRSLIRDKVTEIIVNDEELPVVRSAALGLLTKYKFRTTEQVDKIVSATKMTSDDSIRTYLYEFLIECDLAEDFIDVFLEGIQYVGIGRTDSRLINERMELERGIEKAKSPASVIKILQFLTENLGQVDHLFLKDQLQVIGLNAAIAYETDNSIFDSALILYRSLHKKYWLEEAKDFSRFFAESFTRQRAVKLLFEQRRIDEDNLRALGFLVEEESIEFITQQYLAAEFTNDDIWTIQQGINSGDLYFTFNNHMNEVSNNAFVFQRRRDYQQERRVALKRDIELLFSKEAFIEQAKKIYKTEEKESFNQDEIINVRIKRNENEYSALVIDQIYRMAGIGVISYDKVVETIESWDWDHFSLGKLYEIISSAEDATLTEEQIKWVSDWCMKNVELYNFKTACQRNSNGGMTTNKLAISLWYFLRKYNLKYPEEVLLDMISFDWVEGSQMLGIKYLEQYLDFETMTERVWDNLQKGIEIDDILENHLDFCERHSISDVLPHALQTICDTTRSSTTRTTALQTYMKLSSDLHILIDTLANIHDKFKWEVVRQLFDKGKGAECEAYLIIQLEAGQLEEDELQSIKFLVSLQNLVALQAYVEWIEKHVRDKCVIDRTITLNTISSIESLPFLIRLLLLTYDDDFKQNDFERVDTEVKNAITNVAIQSSENFKAVQFSLESFIRDHTHLKYINFLYVFLEDIESKFYITLQSGRDIYEVKRRLSSIGLES